MACIEHILDIPANHFDHSKLIGTDEIELKYNPGEFDEPIIMVHIETKDGVKVDSHIELCDAVALRDFLNTIIPTMKKQDKENRS